MNWIEILQTAKKVQYRVYNGGMPVSYPIDDRVVEDLTFLWTEGKNFKRLKLNFWNKLFKRKKIEGLYETASLLFNYNGKEFHISNDDKSDEFEGYNKTIKKLGGKRPDNVCFVKYDCKYCLMAYYHKVNKVVLYDILRMGIGLVINKENKDRNDK